MTHYQYDIENYIKKKYQRHVCTECERTYTLIIFILFCHKKLSVIIVFISHISDYLF